MKYTYSLPWGTGVPVRVGTCGMNRSGVMYSVERRLGAKGRPRLANLDGSWITVERDRLAIGERISLIESAPEVSEPDRI